MEDGAFFLTNADGQAIPDVNGDLYEFRHNESVTAIP
jgi:hypothetical protein